MSDFMNVMESYRGQGSGFGKAPNAAQTRFQELAGWGVGGVDYCAITVAVSARDAGFDMPLFTFVSQWVAWMKQNGTWYSKAHPPKRGDIIIFSWSGARSTADAVMDRGAIAEETDHIGTVADYDPASGVVTTFEANRGDRTGYFTLPWNHWQVYGYGRPFESVPIPQAAAPAVAIPDPDFYLLEDTIMAAKIAELIGTPREGGGQDFFLVNHLERQAHHIPNMVQLKYYQDRGWDLIENQSPVILANYRYIYDGREVDLVEITNSVLPTSEVEK